MSVSVLSPSPFLSLIAKSHLMTTTMIDCINNIPILDEKRKEMKKKKERRSYYSMFRTKVKESNGEQESNRHKMEQRD